MNTVESFTRISDKEEEKSYHVREIHYHLTQLQIVFKEYEYHLKKYLEHVSMLQEVNNV